MVSILIPNEKVPSVIAQIKAGVPNAYTIAPQKNIPTYISSGQAKSILVSAGGSLTNPTINKVLSDVNRFGFTSENVKEFGVLSGNVTGLTGGTPTQTYPFGSPMTTAGQDISHFFYDMGSSLGNAFGSGVGGLISGATESTEQSLLSNPYIILGGVIALIFLIKK